MCYKNLTFSKMASKETRQVAEIVISMDTTGSMYPYIEMIRENISNILSSLFRISSNLRVAIIAHGDYADQDCENCYVTKIQDFTDDIKKLRSFVTGISGTCGFDVEECYELVLKETTRLSWVPGSNRLMIILADSAPHEKPFFKKCAISPKPKVIDWRKEVRTLSSMDVRICGINCSAESRTKQFFDEISARTNGFHLRISDKRDVIDALIAVCCSHFNKQILKNYEAELRKRRIFSADMETVFNRLNPSDCKRSENRSYRDPSRDKPRDEPSEPSSHPTP
ncbi:uncharacterized protein LOC141915287, partial [Tubulanus polymorphus]|uniref:uncharacterized protein LOC141915287 n=1 Tax=Tubulanus polymorphus TaxID=672921 RepID=UPI003DA687D6